MAKSIYTQMVEEKEFEIVNDGFEYKFKLANYLNGLTKEIIEDEDKMTSWAKDAGVLHGLLCGGLRDDIIKQRAIVRLKDKDGNAIHIESDAEREKIQKKINGHKPPVITKPGVTGAVSAEKAIEKLIAGGMSIEEILAKYKK